MRELGSADVVRNTKEAFSSSNLCGGNVTANATDDSVAQMQKNMQSYVDSEYSNSEYESAYGTTSSSDSE